MPRSGLLFNPLLVWLIRVADMYVDCVGVGHSPIQSQTPCWAPGRELTVLLGSVLSSMQGVGGVFGGL